MGNGFFSARIGDTLVLKYFVKRAELISCLMAFTVINFFCQAGYAETTSLNSSNNKTPIATQTATHRYLYSIPTKEDLSPIMVNNTVAGMFDIGSNYVYRGISQTNNLPAVQGSVALTNLKTGIYFSLFGSNDYFINESNETATVELDPSIGITNKITDKFSYDINILRYVYPKAPSSDYNELNTYFKYHFITTQISYSNSIFGSGKSGAYFNLGIQYEIPSHYVFNLDNVSISGGMGYSCLSQSAGLHSYKDYNLKLSKTIKDYVISIQWTDTDRQSVDASSIKGNYIIGMVAVNF